MKTLKIACTALILLAGVFAAACSTDPETEAADRVEVSGLDHVRSLMDVFKNLPYRRTGVDVKI